VPSRPALAGHGPEQGGQYVFLGLRVCPVLCDPEQQVIGQGFCHPSKLIPTLLLPGAQLFCSPAEVLPLGKGLCPCIFYGRATLWGLWCLLPSCSHPLTLHLGPRAKAMEVIVTLCPQGPLWAVSICERGMTLRRPLEAGF
jgi:hypothetical protein